LSRFVTALLIANERSGRMLEQGLTGLDLARLLDRAGIACSVATLDGTQTVAALIEAALAEGASPGIVAGGDGTVRSAAQALAGADAALGVLPCSTMNLLAKDLGMPLDLAAAAVALARGRVVAIDLGEVNGEVFTCASLLGMPARLARFRERLRARRGPCRWLSLLRPTWRMLARARRPGCARPRPGRGERRPDPARASRRVPCCARLSRLARLTVARGAGQPRRAGLAGVGAVRRSLRPPAPLDRSDHRTGLA
jgi:hypothetical protein